MKIVKEHKFNTNTIVKNSKIKWVMTVYARLCMGSSIMVLDGLGSVRKFQSWTGMGYTLIGWARPVLRWLQAEPGMGSHVQSMQGS